MSRGTIVDANVLIDSFDADGQWYEWSSDALALAEARGPLVINPIVYAELSVPFDDSTALDSALVDIERRDIPWTAGFLAGKAFREYKRRGGTRTSPLPDFFIGAHAAIEHLDVLTRDPRRVTSYFRTVQVVSPPSD